MKATITLKSYELKQPNKTLELTSESDKFEVKTYDGFVIFVDGVKPKAFIASGEILHIVLD